MHSLTSFFRSLAVVVLCSGATSARAQAPGSIHLTQVAPAALRLHLENPTGLAGSVQVVRLGSGQPLFTETYAGPAYGHRFDFRQVPSGRYLVRIQAGGTTHRCLVRVQTQDRDSAIRRIKLASGTMPAAVVVTTWRPTFGSGTVATTAPRTPVNLPHNSSAEFFEQ